MYGSQKYAVRVQVDPQALAYRGIGIDEVAQAIENANVNLPTGTLYGSHEAFTVQANGQLTNAAAYRPIIVAYKNGAPVRLEEVGRVIDGVENDKVAGWVGDQRAVVLAIQRQPGTNTVEVVERDQQDPAGLPRRVAGLGQHHEPLLARGFDPGLGRRRAVHAAADRVPGGDGDLPVPAQCLRHGYSERRAADVDHRHLRGDVVARLQVDNLSLIAITLSVGFVVDDAIVMLENIVRHMEMGKGVMEAALDGSREIAFTILSMTFSLAAVFIPVLFLGGIMGRLLHEFAVTIAAAILVSGFVSLSLTPMLCSRFLRPPAAERHGRLYMATERGFDRLLEGYRRSLAARDELSARDARVGGRAAGRRLSTCSRSSPRASCPAKTRTRC